MHSTSEIAYMFCETLIGYSSFMYVYMYVCMYMYIYIYIYINLKVLKPQIFNPSIC
jgi:hypothetical protein